MDFGSINQICTVTFNPNGGFFENVLEDSISKNYSNLLFQLSKGSYFYNSNFNIPIPKKDGATFLGWYTSSVVNQVSSKFTDLSIVNSDIVLFAIWG